MVEMNEIERRAQQAWEWRLFSDLSRIKNHDIWCFSIGLWETSGWINDDKDRKKRGRPSQLVLLKSVIPGQRGYAE